MIVGLLAKSGFIRLIWLTNGALYIVSTIVISPSSDHFSDAVRIIGWACVCVSLCPGNRWPLNLGLLVHLAFVFDCLGCNWQPQQEGKVARVVSATLSEGFPVLVTWWGEIRSALDRACCQHCLQHTACQRSSLQSGFHYTSHLLWRTKPICLFIVPAKISFGHKSLRSYLCWVIQCFVLSFQFSVVYMFQISMLILDIAGSWLIPIG